MKRIFLTMLFLSVALTAYGDFDGTTRTNLANDLRDVAAIRDGSLATGKVLSAIDTYVTQVEAYIAEVQGTTNQDLIDAGTELNAIKNAFKSGAANMRSTHGCFILGNCEVE